MDRQSSLERSNGNETDVSDRVVRPNFEAMQLQLLPYDVLRDILSRLSLKEVVRIRVLSREWRQLNICHPDLVFTNDTFGNSSTAGNTQDEEEMTFAELMEIHTKKLDLLTRQFIKNVDRVLRPLWAKHNALDFTSGDSEVGLGSEYDKYKYALPLSNLTGPNGYSVISFFLGNLRLELPPSFCGITNLKKLTLNTVSISGEDLQCLLLSCALLENLSLEWCKSLSTLCIRQDLRRLQDLRVRFCDLEMLELHASDLKTFEFDECVKKIVLNECMKLSEATFVSNLRAAEFDEYGFDFTFTELSTGLPHVHKLFLLLNVDQVLLFSDNQSRFTNLRYLNMNFEIFLFPEDTSWAVGLVNLLELTPFLEEMELHLGRDRFCPYAIRTVKAMQGPLHHHLKSVYMSGFCEVLGLAELALYILGNATTLERMVVDPSGYNHPWNDDIYSVSKGGSGEECLDQINQKRMFAQKNLGIEEFRHILTIL